MYIMKTRPTYAYEKVEESLLERAFATSFNIKDRSTKKNIKKDAISVRKMVGTENILSRGTKRDRDKFFLSPSRVGGTGTKNLVPVFTMVTIPKV